MKTLNANLAKDYEYPRHTLTLIRPIKIRKTAKTVSSQQVYAELTDTELVVACQQRDAVALEHLLKRYQPIIYGMIRHLAPDWKNTNDLVQEALVRVWRSLDQLRNPRSFKAWLHKIVTNLFYDELRKRSHQVQFVSVDEPIMSEDGISQTTRDITDGAPQPEEKLIAGELANLLMKAVATIPSNFRQAAILRDIEGLSYEEIAKITDTELGTVKSRIARARLKIQRQVAPYLDDCA